MTEPLSLITALFLGLFGSSHCLVMCGGISAALSTSSPQNPLSSALLFNFGRIISYSIAGLLVSTLGLWLQSANDVLIPIMRTVAAVLLILMGLYVARWATWLTRLEQLGQHVWKHLQPATGKLMQNNQLWRRFQLGLLWGWLPCGLVYSTLSWAAANGQPLNGMLTMLAFGAGTLPALFATSLAAGSLIRFLNHQWSRRIAGALLMGYGAWTASAIWLL